eukprot:2862684-Ditylum_brightwellii.AAC.1
MTQIIEKEVDNYGCWVYRKFAARNNTAITVITAYKPCKVTKKQGITTYHQQIALLQQDGCTISLRETFTAGLMKWLKEGKQKGEQFMLGGNSNEVLRIGSTLLK